MGDNPHVRSRTATCHVRVRVDRVPSDSLRCDPLRVMEVGMTAEYGAGNGAVDKDGKSPKVKLATRPVPKYTHRNL